MRRFWPRCRVFLKNCILRVYFGIRKVYMDFHLYFKTKKNIKNGIKSGKPVIYYCGIPAHANLGDLAQGVCIRRWINKHFPEYYITEIETDSLVDTRLSCLKYIKEAFDEKNDFVVFQSGYTTTDLGGHADQMHQRIMLLLPDARILMMPQTIFFKNEARMKLCSEIYNSHKKMLFLARDSVSYKMAEQMFPDIHKRCYPDIVTTIIGTIDNNKNKEGILFCLRDDSEKYYSDYDLDKLIKKCKRIAEVSRTDTTKHSYVIKNAEKNIYSEIKKYSKYKVIVTDRYHGTILSLAANTPVVILKTTDHKVVTGAEWFKGIYDGYIYIANDLDDAYNIVENIYNVNISSEILPYFEKEYYDKLPQLFKELV